MSSTPVTTSSGGGCGLIDPQVLAQPLENATKRRETCIEIGDGVETPCDPGLIATTHCGG